MVTSYETVIQYHVKDVDINGVSKELFHQNKDPHGGLLFVCLLVCLIFEFLFKLQFINIQCNIQVNYRISDESLIMVLS